MHVGLVEQNTTSNWAISKRFLQQHLFSLLESRCKTLRHLAQIHANIITNGFSQKNFILVKLLSLYGSFNCFPLAHQLFDQLAHPKSTKLWNQIIRGHLLSGNTGKSIELFIDMGRSSASPDGYTFNFVVSGCTKGGLLREGEQVHAKVLRTGFYSNVHVGSTLVDFYVKCGKDGGVVNAQKVFDEMPDRNVVSWNSLLLGYFECGDVDGAHQLFDDMPERSLVSWTTMISGFVQNGRCKEALALFREMRDENIEFDQVTLVSVLSACAELGDLNLGQWIHSYINESFSHKKIQNLVRLNNSLVHMYSSCGEIGAAFAVFRAMDRRSIVSWTSMITGFAKQGYGDDALRLFKSMISIEKNDLRPDNITFLGVLTACSHSGYVDEGRHYFKSMTESWGVEPKIEHYGCMVDLFSRAGLFNEALELVKSMPMKPNDAICGALLGGCRIYKNVELASDVAGWLSEELDPDRAAGYLVLLSNVYAAGGMWRDVATVRQRMLDTKMKKPPGRSSIQIDEKIHEFVAGDRSHENVDMIYDVLDDVTGEAKGHGYIPYNKVEDIYGNI